MQKREFLAAAGAAIVTSISRPTFASPIAASNLRSKDHVSVDFTNSSRNFPHFWEHSVGSDRTAIGLRAQWREDLIRVRKETGIQSVRSHGLFDDEMGIASHGAGNWNFTYVDQIYDFMLECGVRPFVELSFMPEAFARSGNRIMSYRANVSPPRNWADWHDMVYAFADHCVKRYGITEVSQWQFEVWNEPNLAFWAGSKDEYFELYRQSAAALKSVDKRLLVGGPSTAMLAWVPDFIQYCARNNVPLDFVSTHIYPNDPQEAIFGHANQFPLHRVIPEGLKLVRSQIDSSPIKGLPLLLTEWGSQDPAFIVETIKQSVNLAESISYWTFSNVFEEVGVPRLFNSQFGMLDQWGIERPSLHSFAMLHRLGDQSFDTSDDPVLATRNARGDASLLVWNLVPADPSKAASGNPFIANGGDAVDEGVNRKCRVQLNGWKGRSIAKIRTVGAQQDSAQTAWRAMGKPDYPTKEQIQKLRDASSMRPAIEVPFSPEGQSVLEIDIPANGVVSIELEA